MNDDDALGWRKSSSSPPQFSPKVSTFGQPKLLPAAVLKSLSVKDFLIFGAVAKIRPDDEETQEEKLILEVKNN